MYIPRILVTNRTANTANTARTVNNMTENIQSL